MGNSVTKLNKQVARDPRAFLLLAGMVIGALLISKPGISVAVLPFFVGFAVLLRAIIRRMKAGWTKKKPIRRYSAAVSR